MISATPASITNGARADDFVPIADHGLLAPYTATFSVGVA